MDEASLRVPNTMTRVRAAGRSRRLVPNARYTIATKSGHNVHQDEPELVIAAIRQVVDAVQDPNSWPSR